jgi:hypothetical protein
MTVGLINMVISINNKNSIINEACAAAIAASGPRQSQH